MYDATEATADTEAFVADREAVRVAVVHRGGRFMVSPEMARTERQRGFPARSLYFRGRSAVLGDVPPTVVAELFGIIPAPIVDMALSRPGLPDPATAVAAYREVCWAWGERHLAHDDAGAVAAALYTAVDAADASGLALFAGWRVVQRPDPRERPSAALGHGLMVLRELRGGLHFAALRSVGLSVPEAVLLDSDGGPTRLAQTGWSEDDIAAVRERLGDPEQARPRWERAQEITEREFDRALAVVPDERSLRDALAAVAR